MRKMHLTNAAGRDATVDFAGLKPGDRYQLGVAGKEVFFHRYLATTETGLHEELVERFGEDYADALVDGDPEVDTEQVGRSVGETMQVYLSSDGDVLHAPPEIVEIILDPYGDEKDRRAPQDMEPNVNEELPIRWTGRRLPRGELVRRFAVARTLQVRHYDGLTYDYLHGMAKELDEAGEVVIVGAGPKGRDPLVFQRNGTPYRGFLEGRADGEKYMLLLHLSNMELKLPEPKSEDAEGQEGGEEASP